MKTQILNNAHILGQNNMAANVLILPGMKTYTLRRSESLQLIGINKVRNSS